MAENLLSLTVNTDTRRAVDSITFAQPKSNDVLRLISGERPVIAATFVNAAGTANAFAAGDTFEMDVDIDFVHDEYAGTLNAGYTGAVTSIAITFASDMTGLIRETGSLTLKDTSSPDNRETVDYTAIVLSGGSNEIVTFTVSKTLVNTYGSGDYGAVQDRLMAQATEDDVNTGEWAAADKTLGLVSFRLDCRDIKFTEKLAAAGDSLETLIKMEIKRYPSGSTIPIVLLQDNVYGRQTVRDIENLTIPSDQNWTAADARYQEKDTDAVVSNVAIFDAAGNAYDSGVSIQSVQNALEPQGNWDANANSPDITSETETGKFWIVSVAGSTNLGGITDWVVGDWAIKVDTGWAKADNTEDGKVKGSSGDGTPGFLDAKVDDSSIEVSSNLLQIKALGVDTAELAANAVTTAKITDANVTLAKLAAASVDYTKHEVASSQALTDDTTTNIVLVSATTYQAVKLHVAVKEDADTDFLHADVMIVHDGTNANINTVEIYQPSAGNTLNGPVTFSADVSGGNIRFAITLTSLGTTASAKYKILDAIEAI